ncbi:PREDICTED: zinc finger CCCH-type antiviral protein 1-like isoform X2 [Gekko japonicus]|uniref:Zinc finger CCCH-type antiviral protein 1-like isoform X2 n=1 Tax=Gekko japonicus TaxID=146911 RepID=A0ABM1L9T5_GEKJA|nr:PREDICTED: zinc finger CCCH-type antiviral protein 1-like isoform X2 [Gekko japonicus]
MSDPAVFSFITKILCAGGGAINSKELPQHVELSEQQLEQILTEAGKERFLVSQQGLSCQVLAVSPVRLCLRNECEGCKSLHLCKNYLKGRCYRPTSGRGACKYSHDVFSEENRKVLKDHELSGLNEDELRVLLLQNDPFLLPDVCSLYNKKDGNCPQKEDCKKLHVCRFFLRGTCRFPRCKRSHDLLQPNMLKLLLEEGVDAKMAWNIQTICAHKTAELARELGLQKVHSSNAEAAASGGKKKPSVRVQEECSPLPNPASLPFGFMNLNLKQGVKAAPPSKPPQNEEKKKSDEICLFYVWQFCKHKSNCEMIHYHLPYRWQLYTGMKWNDLPSMEEVEKAYCDPATTSFQNINFKTMMSYINPVRRQSTPSSVTKPAKFVLTTKWLWYWKNDQGQWIEYGKQDGQRQGSALSSDDLENLFLSEPDGSIQFQAGSQGYEINFKDMIQRNLYYLTQREVRRRPKYVSHEDVKNKKGHRDPPSAPIPDPIYPREWDKSALPEIGYKAIELSKTSSEYMTVERLFQKTMNDFAIHSIRRIQNKSLWQVFQWQKDQMKKKKGGQDVEERILFHGTGSSNLEAICSDNFDWRICGTNGTLYGKGSYFARDAHYSHSYCQVDTKVKRSMFVARVLVGDFVVGRQSYSRPPARSVDMTNCYDSCVDKMIDPSIFVIFEKHQIYPAYVISYIEEKKCVLA